MGSRFPCSKHQVSPSILPARELWGKMCCLASQGLQHHCQPLTLPQYRREQEIHYQVR